jgi:hypothetical protein
MVKPILSAVLGYVVMVICVLLGIATVWFAMGPQFAFDGESVNASVNWSLSMIGCGLIAAMIGGFVAAKTAGSSRSRALQCLIALVIVLGLVTFVMQRSSEPQPLPEGMTIETLTFQDAGKYAVSPTWYNVAIVIVGVIGVWIGGRMAGAPPENLDTA